MNAEQLLQHFERISEAPDAIPRLRRFILDLAVRGKLVEQDPSDESVVKRYQNEMGGKDIPETWRVLNFGKYCNIEGGSQPPKSLFIDEPRNGYIRLLQIRDLGDRPVPVYIPSASARSLCREGEILIGRYGASVGKIFWAQNGAYNVAMAKFIWPDDALIPQFAFLLLKSEHLQGKLNMATRSAQAGFNKSDLAPINFPLPPLPEQHRIVAKVDELMSLCDQLEAAKEEREQTRDSLVAASSQGLNQPAEEEESFREHARFTLNILPLITTRTTHIKQLRQTILDLAVRGKLVPQDPSDEPAAELLKRIAAEKARLVKAGRGSNKNTPSPLSNNDQPYSLPSKWEWVRLGSISTSIQYGYTASADMAISVPKFVRITDIHNGRVEWDSVPGCEIEADKLPTYKLEENDFLVARTGGTIGKSFLVANVEHDSVFASYLIRIRVFSQFIYPQFLKYYLESPLYWRQLHAASMGTGQPNVNGKSLGLLKTPVPPLAEQHRIVTKVDELMAVCDQLEAQITQTHQDSRRFLEAFLQEALSPAMAEAA